MPIRYRGKKQQNNDHTNPVDSEIRAINRSLLRSYSKDQAALRPNVPLDQWPRSWIQDHGPRFYDHFLHLHFNSPDSVKTLDAIYKLILTSNKCPYRHVESTPITDQFVQNPIRRSLGALLIFIRREKIQHCGNCIQQRTLNHLKHPFILTKNQLSEMQKINCDQLDEDFWKTKLINFLHRLNYDTQPDTICLTDLFFLCLHVIIIREFRNHQDDLLIVLKSISLLHQCDDDWIRNQHLSLLSDYLILLPKSHTFLSYTKSFAYQLVNQLSFFVRGTAYLDPPTSLYDRYHDLVRQAPLNTRQVLEVSHKIMQHLQLSNPVTAKNLFVLMLNHIIKIEDFSYRSEALLNWLILNLNIFTVNDGSASSEHFSLVNSVLEYCAHHFFLQESITTIHTIFKRCIAPQLSFQMLFANSTPSLSVLNYLKLPENAEFIKDPSLSNALSIYTTKNAPFKGSPDVNGIKNIKSKPQDRSAASALNSHQDTYDELAKKHRDLENKIADIHSIRLQSEEALEQSKTQLVASQKLSSDFQLKIQQQCKTLQQLRSALQSANEATERFSEQKQLLEAEILKKTAALRLASVKTQDLQAQVSLLIQKQKEPCRHDGRNQGTQTLPLSQVYSHFFHQDPPHIDLSPRLGILKSPLNLIATTLSDLSSNITWTGTSALCLIRDHGSIAKCLPAEHLFKHEDIDLQIATTQDLSSVVQTLLSALQEHYDIIPCLGTSTKHNKISFMLGMANGVSLPIDIKLHSAAFPRCNPSSLYLSWNSKGWCFDYRDLTLWQREFLYCSSFLSIESLETNYTFYWALHQHIKHLTLGTSTSCTARLLKKAFDVTSDKGSIAADIYSILFKFQNTPYWAACLDVIATPLHLENTTLLTYMLPDEATFAVSIDLSSAIDRHSFLCILKSSWQKQERRKELLDSTSPIDWSTIETLENPSNYRP